MINKKQVESVMSQLNSMQLLVETYEEIAAMDMRKIRGTVLTNRSFIDEIEEIYQQLKTSYQDQVNQIIAKKKVKSDSITQKNGKTVTIFLSANTRLYGDIVQRTFNAFANYIKDRQTDVVIMGKLGQSLMQEYQPNRQFIYHDLSDTNISAETLTDIISLFLNYEQVYIFYGKFQSLVSQTPYMLDVYGQAQNLKPSTIKHIHYIFEPNLEKILQFFEEQIFTTIIDQSLHESALAKYSARMIALDEATENISQQMKKVNLQKRLVIHHLQNQKQQQSSSIIWFDPK